MTTVQYDITAVDISKDTLEVLSQTKSFSVPNDKEGFATIVEHLVTSESPLVAFEATGGYERNLAEALANVSIPYARINPARIRHFAKSEGIKAKTDPIDARMIRLFAQQKAVRPTSVPSRNQQDIADLIDRRNHLTELLAREKNRIQNSSKTIHASIRKMVKFVEKEIVAIENRIRECVGKDEATSARIDIFTSVVGVGEVTAWNIVANLSEIGYLSRNKVVALCGIAPYNNDSGKGMKKRRIQEGRAKVRKCLYMAAKTAAVHNPVIKEYVDKLRARGKPYKCAIVAAMRKLLIYLQSLLKKHNLALAS